MKKNYFFKFIVFTVLLNILLLSSCKTIAEIKKEKEIEKHIEYVQKERELGRAVFAKIAGKYGVVRNNEATEYLNKLGKALALYTERQDLEYFYAILDSNQINAYSLPGGYILVSLGTLKSINNKGELLGILAHELGHINKKHILKGVKIEVSYNFFEILARILAGPRQVITAVVNQVSDKVEETLFMNGLGYEDEFEADVYAVELLQSLNINAEDYYNYLQRLSEHPNTIEMEALDKTHPDINERLKKIEDKIYPDLPKTSDSEAFLIFKKIIDNI